MNPLYSPIICFSQIDSPLSIEYLLFTLVLRSIRWFIFLSVFTFIDAKFLQVLRSVLKCLIFGFSGNTLSPSFLISVHRILIFLFSCSFCFHVGIQKYSKTMPPLLHYCHLPGVLGLLGYSLSFLVCFLKGIQCFLLVLFLRYVMVFNCN